MKRKLTFLIASAVMLLTMMASTGTMWGQTRSDVTLNIQTYAQANGWTNGTKYTEVTVSPVTFTANGGNNTGKYYTSGNEWRFYQTESASITISVPTDYTLSSIAFTYNVTNTGILKNGNSTVASGSTVSVSGTSATFTVGNSGSASNGQVKFTNIVVTYTTAGGNPVVATPTFTPNGGSFLDSQEVSISCASDGATIYYTLDGSNPSTASIQYTVPFTIEGTTTVKAYAVLENYDDSEVATAVFTKQTPMSVAEARAAIDAGAGTQGVYVTGIVSAIPTAWNTQYNNITFNIVDETGDEDFLQAFRCVSTTNADASTVAVGDIVIVYGNLTLYNSTYELNSGCQLISLTQPVMPVATPTFSPAAGTYTEAQTVTISCATEDVDIYYTTNGEDPDDESTPYNGPITVSTTTTIKAIAYDSNDNQSAVASATYTITAPLTIAEVRAQGTGSVLTQGVVTSCVGTTGYIQDATAAICVYGTALTVGDEITVSGSLSTYKGLLEITSPVVTVLSSGNTVTPTVKTIEEINTDYAGDNALQGWYVKIENATVTAISGSGNQQNTTIEQGENTIVVRGNLNTDSAAVVGDILTLDGNIGCFDAPQIANPQNVTIYVNNDPVINADNIEIAYDATEGVINYTITNPVQGVSLTASCEADWISNIVVGEATVTFTITVNESEEDRTATITLSYTGADNKEVTVTQGHYVVDYATLPFEFDGGKADIETTDGLTSSGNLGGDYGSSPKLKFSATGNCLILHFNEEPGALTFDIKGNGSGSTPWAGTFTVMASENGSEYTELVAYTELSSTTESKLINNIGANVRYIKWVYTEKTLGNVALGNIYLYEAGGGPVVEAYNLTVEPYENLEIFVFVEDENNPGLEEAGTIQVNEGDNVMLSVTANEGYVMQSLMVDGVEHVNDITEEATYTFQMPGHDVTINATAVEYVPFEPVTYTLATTVEPGKSYIIVGGKTVNEETTYYAMGLQNNNNRAAVGISVDGTTATVNTADVYEFVISTDETDNSLFNIYDAVNDGYLYAAGGTSSNYLKTKSTIEETGQWAIVIDQDGVASIVANFGDEKANTQPRNTMRFNSGNVPPIFSCYGADNTMNDVYLYVKDENPGFVTQTIELVEGWNWVSFYVEGDPFEMLTQLETSLGDKGLSIESQYYSTEFDGEEWFGELDFEAGLTSDLMYLINVTEDCTITLQGTQAVTETVEITINPGWNWIGFPSAVEIDIPVAMSGFDAEEEDTIENQQEGAEYDGEEWFGFETLIPGQGLLYFSNSTETKYLIFQTGSRAGRFGPKK